MDNSLLAVRDIDHKYIVVERLIRVGFYVKAFKYQSMYIKDVKYLSHYVSNDRKDGNADI